MAKEGERGETQTMRFTSKNDGGVMGTGNAAGIMAFQPDALTASPATPSATLGAFRRQYVSRVPAHIKDTLDEEQLTALADIAAAMRAAWANRHRVDIRMSIPLFFSRYYLTVLSGPDGRNGRRNGEDGVNGPLRRLANVMFIGLVAAGFYTVAGLALLIYSSVLSL